MDSHELVALCAPRPVFISVGSQQVEGGWVDAKGMFLAGVGAGPVYKLLGGARDRVKAYASTYPNLGAPRVYADHALACKREGYLAYKIHPHYFWDPATRAPSDPLDDITAGELDTICDRLGISAVA